MHNGGPIVKDGDLREDFRVDACLSNVSLGSIGLAVLNATTFNALDDYQRLHLGCLAPLVLPGRPQGCAQGRVWADVGLGRPLKSFRVSANGRGGAHPKPVRRSLKRSLCGRRDCDCCQWPANSRW